MKPDTIILTQQSFDKLFRLYQRKLYAVAYSLVHDANTAEDIVHDSFMTIWENRETVQFTSIEAYLFGVVKKRCLKYRRDRYTGKAVYEKILMKERGVMDFYTRTIESCNPNELFQREIIEICRKQLKQMPELTKQVFITLFFIRLRMNLRFFQFVEEQFYLRVPVGFRRNVIGNAAFTGLGDPVGR